MLTILTNLHKNKIIHRDISPNNFVIGMFNLLKARIKKKYI